MNIAELKAALADRAEEFAFFLYPNAKREGQRLRVGDLDGNPGDSMSITIAGNRIGVWKDFSSDESGDNLLDLFAKKRGLDFSEACTAVADWLGVTWDRSNVSKALPVKNGHHENGHRKPCKPYHWDDAVDRLSSQLIADLSAKRHFSVEFIEWAHAQRFIGAVDDNGTDRIAFPVVRDGKVCAAHAKVMRNGAESWTYLYDGDEGPGTQPLVMGDTTTPTVWVFESQWDAMAVMDRLGFHERTDWDCFVFVTRGAGNGGLVARVAQKGRTVILWPQNDEAKANGKIPSEDWAAACTKAANGCDVRRVQTPAEFEDPDAWMASGAAKPVILAAINNAADGDAERQRIKALIKSHRFDFSRPPEQPIPLFTINEQSVATRKNIQSIAAQAKQGKSAFLSAMIAAWIRPGAEYLGVTCSLEHKGAIVHIDTEQSPFDHWWICANAIRRAQVAFQPPGMHSVHLMEFEFKDRATAIRQVLEDAKKESGSICAVFIDGLADLVMNVNDIDECVTVREWVHRLAVEFDTAIFCVVHENEGSDNGKMRGHLGSEIARKAETNLRLQKDAEGTITIWSEKSRHLHLTKEDGPRFVWSAQEGMHVLKETLHDAKTSEKRDQMEQLADKCFANDGGVGLTYSGLIDEIKRHERVSEKTAERRLKDMIEVRAIWQNHRGYHRQKGVTAGPPK